MRWKHFKWFSVNIHLCCSLVLICSSFSRVSMVIHCSFAPSTARNHPCQCDALDNLIHPQKCNKSNFLGGAFNASEKYLWNWIISPGRVKLKNAWKHHQFFAWTTPFDGLHKCATLKGRRLIHIPILATGGGWKTQKSGRFMISWGYLKHLKEQVWNCFYL